VDEVGLRMEQPAQSASVVKPSYGRLPALLRCLSCRRRAATRKLPLRGAGGGSFSPPAFAAAAAFRRQHLRLRQLLAAGVCGCCSFSPPAFAAAAAFRCRRLRLRQLLAAGVCGCCSFSPPAFAAAAASRCRRSRTPSGGSETRYAHVEGLLSLLCSATFTDSKPWLRGCGAHGPLQLRCDGNSRLCVQ
jgi:hypothetical protein